MACLPSYDNAVTGGDVCLLHPQDTHDKLYTIILLSYSGGNGRLQQSIFLILELHTANPPEACCRGSPAATKVPFASLSRPCAVDWPGATHVTLCPKDFMKATVSLLYAYSKLTWFGSSWS